MKEYPSLLQSRRSASYQTLRMWIAGPHRRPPHLGPFVSSSKDSLHQPERASSSSVQPEGLRTSVGRPVCHSVLRQHHHSSVCPSPAAIHHALVLCHSGRSQSSHMLIGPEWTLNQDIVLRLFWSDSPHGGRLLRLRSDSPHGGHLRLPRSDSLQRGHPHLSEWDSLQTQGLAPPGDPFLGIHALQGHAPPGIPSLKREVPLPLNDDAMSLSSSTSLISIWNCFQTFLSYCRINRSATTDPFPPLESDLPVPQLTMWLLSTDSPVSPAFLRQVIHDFHSFKGRSDLWIFKLDGLPLRCDAKLMFDHPHSCLPSLLNS